MSSSNFDALIGEVLGQHLKCGKGGIFTLDGAQIPTGPDGFRFTALAGTAAYGRVRFEDDFPVERNLRLFGDSFPRYGEELPDGWSWASWMLGVGADDQLLTFTGAYGPWRTLRNLFSQYLIRGAVMLPVCALSTRPRGDVHNNVDPIFNIVAWRDAAALAESFPGLVTAERLKLAGPASGRAKLQTDPAPAESEPFGGPDSIDDAIPF
jgi:hypothetical protein